MEKERTKHIPYKKGIKKLPPMPRMEKYDFEGGFRL